MIKNIICIIIALSLTGCATVHRHPVVTGVVGGAAVGITVAVLTRRGTCPKIYDGKPYSGTPPCPQDSKPDLKK